MLDSSIGDSTFLVLLWGSTLRHEGKADASGAAQERSMDAGSAAAAATPAAAPGEPDTPITNGLFLLQDAAASILDQPGAQDGACPAIANSCPHTAAMR